MDNRFGTGKRTEYKRPAFPMKSEEEINITKNVSWLR